MATYSGVYSFSPGTGDLVLFAYALVGVRRSEIVAEHMVNARLAANLVLSDWASKLVNAWAVELTEETLVAGQAEYDMDPNTVTVLDAYIRTEESGQDPVDRIIYPVSRTEYASFPDKAQQAPPTSFYYNKLLEPTITLWPVPDDATTYTLRYYRVRQVQDADYTNGQNIEIPYRFFLAFAYAISVPLAVIYMPEKVQLLEGQAMKTWETAANTDAEQVPMSIIPGLSGYWT